MVEWKKKADCRSAKGSPSRIRAFPRKGAVNIYGNMGPGNERWPVVKFTVAPLILPYKIVYGPLSA